MWIKTVAFEVTPEGIAAFEKKMQRDLASLAAWETCLSAECWLQNGKTTTTFQLVSKWTDPKDFQAWLKRPEHRQHHRQASQEHDRPKIVVSKTMAAYAVLDFD